MIYISKISPWGHKISINHSIVASIPACHAGDLGSTSVAEFMYGDDEHNMRYSPQPWWVPVSLQHKLSRSTAPWDGWYFLPVHVLSKCKAFPIIHDNSECRSVGYKTHPWLLYAHLPFYQDFSVDTFIKVIEFIVLIIRCELQSIYIYIVVIMLFVDRIFIFSQVQVPIKVLLGNQWNQHFCNIFIEQFPL